MNSLWHWARRAARTSRFHTRRLRRALAPHWLPGTSRSWGPPRRFAVDVAAAATEVRWHPVYPAAHFVRPLPKVCGGPAPSLFEAARASRWPAVGVAEIAGGRAWGHYGAAVITPSDALIGEFSRDVWSPPEHTAFLRWKLPACRRFEGTVAVVATPEAATNYWHWTTELLPRLHLLEAAGFPLASIDRFLINFTAARYQRESLAELGIPADRLVLATPALHLQAERLLVPSVNHHQGEIAPWAFAWLRRLPHACASPCGRRLFLSRAGASFRRLRNEAAAANLARRHGFEVVHPERWSLPEQRAAMAQAEWVIGPHGSGFTNTLWCRPGTKVAEFFARQYIDLVFWKMAATLGFDYACLLEPGTAREAGARDRFADYAVDLDALADYLRTNDGPG